MIPLCYQAFRWVLALASFSDARLAPYERSAIRRYRMVTLDRTLDLLTSAEVRAEWRVRAVASTIAAGKGERRPGQGREAASGASAALTRPNAPEYWTSERRRSTEEVPAVFLENLAGFVAGMTPTLKL